MFAILLIVSHTMAAQRAFLLAVCVLTLLALAGDGWWHALFYARAESICLCARDGRRR
jgi:hypothetical protein